MADDRYGNNAPDDPFCVESTFEFPSMDQMDPNPNGTLDSVPNATISNYGTGGETLMPDGDAKTRYKTPGAVGGYRGLDGGTP